MLITRQVASIIAESKKSILLIGPRQTGKSTLISSLSPDLSVNFARESTFLEFASDPTLLDSQIRALKPKTIFIDEVQRLPSVLNTVQALIDETRGDLRFYLTGSSARKLRRGRANLLPGRIITLELGPLLESELGDDYDLSTSLSVGTLPGIITNDNARERERILTSYAGTYLKEEIQAEALTRDLEGFARFLRYCAAASGQYLDMTRLAAEAQVKRASAIRFFEILEDTLIAFRCDAFAKSERRRLIQHPRFFFFDNGVLNGILGNFKASDDRRGMLFEHLVISQVYHAAKALGGEIRLSNYRTEHGAELDLIIERADGEIIAVECKSGNIVGANDFEGFKSFSSYTNTSFRKIVIYGGTTPRRIGDVDVLPFAHGIREISRFIGGSS
jgi:predicted AAA+ superfamily ATPase